MAHRTTFKSRPSLWAVAAFCGSSVFLLATMMLVAMDYRPF
jgi:hypothetical protein